MTLSNQYIANHLRFIHARLHHVYEEPENLDFMLTLRDCITELDNRAVADDQTAEHRQAVRNEWLARYADQCIAEDAAQRAQKQRDRSALKVALGILGTLLIIALIVMLPYLIREWQLWSQCREIVGWVGDQAVAECVRWGRSQ